MFSFRKVFLPLILLVASLGSPAFSQFGEELKIWDFKPLADNPIQKSICVIRTSNGYGTGIVLSDSLVLTCNHVVGDLPTLNVDFPIQGKSGIKGVVVLRSVSTDLAFIVCKVPKGVKPIKMSSTAVKVGDKVQFLGFAGFKKPRHFDAKVLDVEKSGNSFLCNSFVCQGDSGGALLNSKGELVGVITAGMIPLNGGKPLKFQIPQTSNSFGGSLPLALTKCVGLRCILKINADYSNYRKVLGEILK